MKLQTALSQAARKSGHGQAFYRVVNALTKGTGYEEDMIDIGISSDTFLKIAKECAFAFNDACEQSGLKLRISFSSMEADVVAQTTQAAANRFIDNSLLASKGPAADAVEFAREHLSEKEFFAVAARDLYFAANKMSRDDVAKALGITVASMKSSYYTPGKTELKTITNNRGLPASPYFRTRQEFKDTENLDLGKLSFDTLDMSDPRSIALYEISSTIFNIRDHQIICYELLQAPSIIRDRADFSAYVGINQKHYSTVLFPSLVGFLKRAVDEASPEYRLTGYIETLRSGLIFAGCDEHKPMVAIDQINEDLIDLTSLGASDILGAAYVVGRGIALPNFVMKRLYNAEHKTSDRTFKGRTGYERRSTIKNGGEYLRNSIRDYLVSHGKPDVAAHPSLHGKTLPVSKQDKAAAKLIRQESFRDLIKSLDGEDLQRCKIARTAYSASAFYCFIMREFADPQPTLVSIANQIGYDSDSSVHNMVQKVNAGVSGYLAGFSQKTLECEDDKDAAFTPN